MREIDWDGLGKSGDVCQTNVQNLCDSFISAALTESQKRGDTVDQRMAAAFQSARAVVSEHVAWLEMHQAKRDAEQIEHGEWVVELVGSQERFWARMHAVVALGSHALCEMVDATWPDGPGGKDAN